MEEYKAIKGKRLISLTNEYIGKSFGKLTITEIIGIKKKRTVVRVSCECGNIKELFLYNLLRNCTKSCGCISLLGLTPGHLKHGEAKAGKESLEYLAYLGMKSRVSSASEKVREKYKNFSGISICPRWLDVSSGYKNFLEDMRRKPDKNHYLARKDRTQGFSKDNCEWRARKMKAIEKNIKEAWESGKSVKFKDAVYGRERKDK